MPIKMQHAEPGPQSVWIRWSFVNGTEVGAAVTEQPRGPRGERAGERRAPRVPPAPSCRLEGAGPRCPAGGRAGSLGFSFVVPV